MNEQIKIPQADGKVQIMTNLNLWNTPFGDNIISTKRKLTKGETFYDQLQRQKRELQEDQEALPGNFQSLAYGWRWHCQAVMRFIEELASIGAITIERNTNQTVIQVTHMTIAPGDALDHGHTIMGDKISHTGTHPDTSILQSHLASVPAASKRIAQETARKPRIVPVLTFGPPAVHTVRALALSATNVQQEVA